jgi:hypothetical protein
MTDILNGHERRSLLSILKAPPKQPKTVTVQARVEESVKTQLELYAEFIDVTELLVPLSVFSSERKNKTRVRPVARVPIGFSPTESW